MMICLPIIAIRPVPASLLGRGSLKEELPAHAPPRARASVLSHATKQSPNEGQGETQWKQNISK
jgi:hypothetical protein